MDTPISISIDTRKQADGSVEIFINNGLKDKFLCTVQPMRCEVTGNLLGYVLDNKYFFNGIGSVLHYMSKKVTNHILNLSYEIL